MPATPIYYTVVNALVGRTDGYQSLYRIETTHPQDRAAGITEILYLPDHPRRYVYSRGAAARRVTARHRKAVQRALRRWRASHKAHAYEFDGTHWSIWSVA